MSAPAPLWFEWNGEVMVPVSRRPAQQQFEVRHRYRLEHREERSSASHQHYFACIAAAWESLPPDAADRFATPEHLRKWALIKAGYRDERSFICASKAEAQRLAVFIRPMDDFAVVSVAGTGVVVLTAKSQSMKAMGKADFQASKDAVLDIIAQFLGVPTEALGEVA
jgi:hypothetical protein